MIQRIQTLWLFLAGLVNAGVFYFDLYRGYVTENNAQVLKSLYVGREMPLLLIAIVMVILPWAAIGIFFAPSLRP